MWFPVRQVDSIFVEGVGPVVETNAVDLAQEVSRKNSRERLSQDIGAREAKENLHTAVPTFDVIIEVDCKDADVDRFDDVLVELFQALELPDLPLQSAIKLGVLNRDPDIASE